MAKKFLSNSRNCIKMLCCTTIGIFIYGTARLSSQLFVACMVSYNARRKDASFPFTLCYTMRNIAGPVIAYLGRKFGAEAVTASGCVLSVIGVGACFFAEHINEVIVFWGVLYGLGFGLGSALVPEILANYFKKHYDKANGVFLGGSGLAAILLPFLTEYLLFTYGTSGTFLILSGLILNSVVAALFLCKFKHKTKPFEAKFHPNTLTGKSRVHSASFQDLKQNKVPVESLENLLKCPENPLKSKQDSKNHLESSRQYSRNHLESSRQDTRNHLESPRQNSRTHLEYSKQHSRDHLEYSRQHSSEYKPSDNCMSYCCKETIKNLNETTEMPETKGKLIILEMIQIFVNPAFLIVLITQSVTAFLFTMVWTVIVDFSMDAGVTMEQSVYILMAVAIADCGARFFLGCITDAGYISKLNFSALCYALFGAVMVSLVAMNGLIMMTISGCAIGLLTGGLIMIGPGIILTYIEKEKVTIALSFRYMLHPIIGFAQPYLIAYFRDTMGSYNGIFYLCATVSWACCLLSMLLPVASKNREKKKQDLEKGCLQKPSN